MSETYIRNVIEAALLAAGGSLPVAELMRLFDEGVRPSAQAIRTARPIAGGNAVRMPFDRSRQDRQRRLADDRIDVPDVLFEQLTKIAGPETA